MATSWRAAVTVQTNSQRLARLNNVVIVFEFDIDAEGNILLGLGVEVAARQPETVWQRKGVILSEGRPL